MREGYKQPNPETDNKRKKIEDYFSGQKRQEPKIEEMQKPEAAAESSGISKVEKELNLAREQYVSANFEIDSALIKIKKFLHVKEDFSDKEALNLRYSRYKSKLNELLSLKIDELKSQNPENAKIGEKIKDLMEKFNLDEKATLQKVRAKFEPQQERAPENQEKTMESFRSAISLGKEWKKIKDMNFREATEKMDWRGNNKVETIFRDIKEKLGNEARPGSDETLERWTERVSELTIEKGK
jgi:hypothetical protein